MEKLDARKRYTQMVLKQSFLELLKGLLFWFFPRFLIRWYAKE